jgi:hypothetical protein
VVETAFVFTTMLMLALAAINLGTAAHTHFIANYAAFMATRSFQVYGVGTGADFFLEGDEGLLESEVTASVIRVAEDIFTCSLPWFSPPENDVINPQDENQMYQNCHEGNRKYENTNIDSQLRVLRFDRDQKTELEVVTTGYSEEERDPLRFGILQMRYKRSLLRNPFGIFDGMRNIDGEEVFVDDEYRSRVWHQVHMPLLLNPGLDTGELQESNGRDNGLDERE